MTSNRTGNSPSCALLALVFIACGHAALADQIDLTGFTTSNDIYTNLNQQFPNTGPGTPGSTHGTPNATFLYNPATWTSANFVAGSDSATNGIEFLLSSDSTGRDFEEISGPAFSFATEVSGVTEVHLLTAAYQNTGYTATFTGTGGASETFTNVSAPNFFAGGALNTTSGGALDQSVLEVDDEGAGGSGNSGDGFTGDYFLYEQSFTLNSSFNGQSLTDISLTNTGGGGTSLLLLGVTAETASSTPEPSTLALFGFAAAGFALCRRRR